MIYNAGWANLKPQESKYTPALAAEAAKLLESGQNLSAVSRSLNISRATLRNWRNLNPKLNASFAVFEANKLKKAQHQLHVRKFKQVAEEIVEAAREGNSNPVEAGVKAHQQAEAVEDEVKPISAAEREQRRLQAFFDSDWGPIFEEQQAQAEAEREAAERDRCGGFWCG
jgi:hypothetical protein